MRTKMQNFRYGVAAALWFATIAGICPRSASVLMMAGAAEKPVGGSISPSISDELSHLGAVKFNTRLQDAADENTFTDLPVVITISHVVADAGQCHISYRRQLQREESSREEQRRFDLSDIGEIKVEPFESFENEHQGQPGWVYTMTDPQMSAVVIIHADGSMDWFAVTAGDRAKRLSEDIRRRGDYCRRGAAP